MITGGNSGHASRDEFLKAHHDAIISSVTTRMRGDEDMIDEATRSGVTLGSTAAMEQNMKWLESFRSGHDIPFDGKAVRRCFAVISDDVRSRPEAPELRAEYSAYETKVGGLIGASFAGLVNRERQ